MHCGLYVFLNKAYKDDYCNVRDNVFMAVVLKHLNIAIII